MVVEFKQDIHACVLTTLFLDTLFLDTLYIRKRLGKTAITQPNASVSRVALSGWIATDGPKELWTREQVKGPTKDQEVDLQRHDAAFRPEWIGKNQ